MLLICSSTMLFATSIRNIRAEEYYDSVCRLVLDMDSGTEFTVEKVADGFRIILPQFDGKIPTHSLQGTFLSAIEPYQNGVIVKSRENLHFYTLRLSDSKALVVDFYKADSGKASRLAIARFNSDKGRLVNADRDFSKLAADYPNNYDILYYWGILLMKRESTRAREKLEQIPPTSSFYSSAQSLLQSGQDPPRETSVETKPSSNENIALLEESEWEDTEELPDSVVFRFTPIAEESSPAPWYGNMSVVLKIILYILILSALLATIFAIFRKLHRNSIKERSNENIEVSKIALDTNTLTRMINRLLADGWTSKEIAREMKITVPEVEQVIRRLHRTGGIDDGK